MTLLDALISDADKLVLRYAGALGHTFVVVISSRDGKRHAYLETDSLASAKRGAAEYPDKSPVIYSRQTGKWEPVR